MKSKVKGNKMKHTSFANPKSASFTHPFESTNMLAHLISLYKNQDQIKSILCNMYL